MIERSAFTDINRYLLILTNTYSNYKEYWLISVILVYSIFNVREV